MVSNRPEQYRNRLLALIAALVVIAALRASYAVVMPIAFAALIVAALWPLKCWLDRWLPSWMSYTVAVLALLAVLVGFAASVYFSIGQVIGVLSTRWPAIRDGYDEVARWAAGHGIPLTATADQRRVLALLEMLASSAYAFATYTGFIGLLVILGLPEVPRFRGKLRAELETRQRSEVIDMAVRISSQIRRYMATTLATSTLTGIASIAWALTTGLDLALVWGLLNFLLNFIPVIGNIIGIVPPVLYAFVQFEGWTMPLLVFVGFAALQIAISNFVYPILQGKQLALSPLAIILAMTFWGWVWGIAGALIAVPLSAAIIIICRNFERTRWIATLTSA